MDRRSPTNGLKYAKKNNIILMGDPILIKSVGGSVLLTKILIV